MFGWFKKRPAPEPIKPILLHRWYVDVSAMGEGDGNQTRYDVIRYSWDDLMGDWVNETYVARFKHEDEARAFIEKHAHLPQAFDVQKGYEGASQ